ncbi:MAG: LmbE family N-acetylglucosaminyl deacetylase [Flavobacteriaceae bacterium]|jgi:LmbE family N-acetylglucosaminyl deacetylase|tara:strand:- start:17350 stop:18129 length:780 start_codon:yes stop_codon:yes gene_type:complete
MYLIKPFLICLFLSSFLCAQEGSKKLLAIFAHPDDEQSIGPLLVKYAEEGTEVTLVIATDGRLGVNEYTDYKAGDALAAIRRKEMLCAAEVLGVTLKHLTYHDQLKAAEGFDGHIPHVQQLILDIKDIVTEIQPDAIITWGPDGVTTHMDHRLVGASVTQVFVSQTWESPMDLYYFGVPSDFIPSAKQKTIRGQDRNYLTAHIPFTQAHFDTAYQALLCHKSQYPEAIIAKIKEERSQMGKTIFLRQFQVPNNIRNTLF